MSSEHKDAGDGKSTELGQETLLTCVDALEDLLLDDVMPADIYLGDDVDESKEESSTMFSEVRSLCVAALPSFIQAIEDELSVGEYTLQHQQYHSQFLEIIEQHLEDRLSTHSVSLRSFAFALRAALSATDYAEPDAIMMFATAKELLDVLDCVQKFTNFAEGMRIKALQYKAWKEEGDDEWFYGRRPC